MIDKPTRLTRTLAILLRSQRKAATAPSKSSFSLVAWAGVCISLVALGSSGVTAYYNVVRQTDDIRVILADAPWVFVDDLGQTNLLGIQRITFINAGNRSASVTDVSLGMAKPKSENRSAADCSHDPTLYFVYADDGFVIKPGEITIKLFNDIHPSISQLWKIQPGNTHTSIIKWYDRGDIALTCIRLSIVTPDGASSTISIPKYFSTVSAKIDIKPRWAIPTDKPYSVVRHLGWIFNQ